MVRSYELGVLLLPSLEAGYRAHRHCGFSCTPNPPVALPAGKVVLHPLEACPVAENIGRRVLVSLRGLQAFGPLPMTESSLLRVEPWPCTLVSRHLTWTFLVCAWLKDINTQLRNGSLQARQQSMMKTADGAIALDQIAVAGARPLKHRAQVQLSFWSHSNILMP